MGAGTRHINIRRRQKRREKREQKQRSGLRKALQRGRTHQDRVKIAEEYWQKLRSGA